MSYSFLPFFPLDCQLCFPVIFVRLLPLSCAQVNEISEGGYFGELGLMTHQPRATSIVAKGEVKLACKYNSQERAGEG